MEAFLTVAVTCVRFVLINPNDAAKHESDSFDNMKIRAAEKNYPFAYLQDESQEVARSYGAERTPEVYLLDNNNALRYHGAIDDNYENAEAVDKPYLKAALEAMLSGEEVEVKESSPVGCTIKWK